ncbi:hypothetical protein DSO57_1028391 [Entomophthora muscae]|uniref:Uncharacterized protein n=1 Tax=Entomophthora muscae TaxID=34485 RepID=A0ACC2U0Y8_9FUNG|nr:hypothetical protein DSO57_1028391 [Entomophthora muscae]
MSAHNSNQTSLRQIYPDLMAGMTKEEYNAFMQMPRPSQVCFLNQLLPANNCQLRPQDCDTTVAGSEHGTVTPAKGDGEANSIFAEAEAPLIQLPCLGFEDLLDWSNNIVLETALSPLATPSALICTCCNSKELPSAYPAIINWFGISHHEEKLYVYVQALFAKDDAVTPICSGACYHSSYNVERLIGEVDLCLHVTAKDTSGFSLQHVYTITQRNQYVREVACIWALDQSANSELPCTLGLDLQDNAPRCFSLALHLFVQAMKENNLQLYLPLAASVTHLMWYPPKVCSSGTVGFAGCCLEHFCRLAYQSKISLPVCYSYMEDVLLDFLTIVSAFSACGGWGRLVHEGNLFLPLCGWTGMSCNSQLAWCQMLVALAFVRNQMDNDEYELIVPLVPCLTPKRPCSNPSCHSIPHLPADSAPSTGTSSKIPANWSCPSGSRCCPSE